MHIKINGYVKNMYTSVTVNTTLYELFVIFCGDDKKAKDKIKHAMDNGCPKSWQIREMILSKIVKDNLWQQLLDDHGNKS